MLTVQELYQFAKEYRLLDAPIRICDGMAVNYYPTVQCVERGRYEVVIDVSTVEPIDYDELNENAELMRNLTEADRREIDASIRAMELFDDPRKHRQPL